MRDPLTRGDLAVAIRVVGPVVGVRPIVKVVVIGAVVIVVVVIRADINRIHLFQIVPPDIGIATAKAVFDIVLRGVLTVSHQHNHFERGLAIAAAIRAPLEIGGDVALFDHIADRLLG